MDLNINLKLEDDVVEKKVRAKKATTKKTVAKYEPTWEEVWQKIWSMKLTNSDRVKLKEVRVAIDTGEIGTGVESLRKFTKAHALRQYQELKAIRS